MLALLTENGACLVDPNSDGSKATVNKNGWNSNATVIWIDQPGGAGFSYTDAGGFDRNEADVSRDMYKFIQAWFKAHPSFQGRPFFVLGESYGVSGGGGAVAAEVEGIGSGRGGGGRWRRWWQTQR